MNSLYLIVNRINIIARQLQFYTSYGKGNLQIQKTILQKRLRIKTRIYKTQYGMKCKISNDSK